MNLSHMPAWFTASCMPTKRTVHDGREAWGLSWAEQQPDQSWEQGTEWPLVMRPFSGSFLRPFQSAWFPSCQVLPRQALQKGLSWRVCTGNVVGTGVSLFPQICSKLLIGVRNCWRRGSLAAHQHWEGGALPPGSLLSSVSNKSVSAKSALGLLVERSSLESCQVNGFG